MANMRYVPNLLQYYIGGGGSLGTPNLYNVINGQPLMVLTQALALVMVMKIKLQALRPQQQQQRRQLQPLPQPQFQTIQAQYWYSVVTLPTAQLTR